MHTRRIPLLVFNSPSKGGLKGLLMMLPLVAAILFISFCMVLQFESNLHHQYEHSSEGFIFAQAQTINAFSTAQKQAIIDKHNFYRLQDTLNPPASDMTSIAWDDTLAQTAANYVDTCVWGHNGNRGQDVGENIYIVSSSNNAGVDAVIDWASEKADYTYENGCATGKTCGHYTQIIWASTTKVGCTFKTCNSVTNLDFGGDYVVCDYSPAGNYVGEKPYTAGSVSSPSNSTSSAFNPTFGTFSKSAFTKSEILAHRTFLLDGVAEIPSNIYSSYFFPHGTNAFPIIISEEDNVVAIAGSYYGKGRVVAFGNGAYLNKADSASTLKLLSNAVKWTTKSKSDVTYMLHNVNDNTVYSSMTGITKYTTTSNAFDSVNKPLESIDLLIISLQDINEITPEMTTMIRDFLERGGGIITGLLGFYHKYQYEPDVFAGNVWFADFGVTFYNSWYAGGRFLAATEEQVVSGKYNPYWALDSIITEKPETITTDTLNKLKDQLTEIINSVQKPVSLDSAQTFYKVAELFSSYCASITLKAPFKTSSEKLCVRLINLLNYLNSLPVENNPEVLTAETVIPGPTLRGETFRNTPSTTNQVSISTIRTGWQCTGFYALPGGSISISVNSTSGISRVVIGGHTDDISGKDVWPRFPKVSTSKLINSITLTTSTFTTYSGGIIYIDVNSKPVDFTVTITGQVVKVPFFKKGVNTNQDWLTSRNYSSPFIEVEGTHFSLSVKSTPESRTIDDIEAIADYWGENVMNLYYELSQRPVRDYKERFQTDIEISAGYMHSGYPIMAYPDQDVGTLFANNPSSLPLKANTAGRWGHYHELGHNFQVGDWTYSSSGELTVNIFTLYLEEHYPGGSQTYGERDYNPPNREGNEYNVMKSTDDFKGDWSFAGQLFHMDLIKGFGWIAMKKFFASYVNNKYEAINIGKNLTSPVDDLDKRNQWLMRYSNIVQRNLGPIFALYNFPVSQSAFDSVKHLPSWMPTDFVIDCSNAIYPESPCMSLSISDNRNGSTSVKYTIDITTWSPIKPYYGEHLVITFNGYTAPRFQNNQTITLTNIVGGDINPQVTVTVTPEKTILPIYSNFIASGQKISFSFTTTNSYRAGQVNTTVKHINSQNVLINVFERPLEIQKSIILSDKVGPMLCDYGFYGDDCSISTCFDYIGSDSKVCSGHGKCIALDTCQCNGEYFGPECQDVTSLTRELVSIHQTSLLQGVTTITADYSSYFILHGPNVFPVFTSASNKVVTVVAGSYNGKGRIIAFGNGGYLHPETYKDANLLAFMNNAVRWVTKKKRNVKYLLHSVGTSFFKGLDGLTLFEGTSDAFDSTLKPLESIDLLIISLQDLTTITDSMKASLLSFMERGGSIMTGALGWWWPYSDNYDPLKFPGNILFAEFGMTWRLSYPYGGFMVSTSYPLDDMNIYWRIQTAVSSSSLSSVTNTDISTINDVIASVPSVHVANLALFSNAPAINSLLCPISVFNSNTVAKSFCVLWNSTIAQYNIHSTTSNSSTSQNSTTSNSTGTNTYQNSTASTNSTSNNSNADACSSYNITTLRQTVECWRSELLRGVSSITSRLASYFYLHGPRAIPLFFGDTDHPVAVAASYFGKGRLCAFGHDGYLSASADGTNYDTLLKNCVKWTTSNKANVKYFLHDNSYSTYYNSIPGLLLDSASNDVFNTKYNPLDSADLLILNLQHIAIPTDAMIKRIRDFLERGGAIICAVTGWAHTYASQPELFAGNIFFSDMGISFYTAYFAGSPYVSSISYSLDNFNTYWALDTITQNFTQVTTDTVKNIGTSLAAVVNQSPKPTTMSTSESFTLIDSLNKQYCSSNISIIIPATTTSQKLCIYLVNTLNMANALSLINNPQISIAEKIYPGLPSNGLTSREAPSITVQVTISTIRTAWQCTGYYALPGANLTISVNSTTGISSIVVGGQTDDVSKKDQWDRWPTISTRAYISTVTKSTPWFISYSGGMIYIDVSSAPLDLSVTITGQIVKAPFWKKGLHTEQDWLTIRDYPAPYTEIEGTHFVFAVRSTKEARTLSNVTELADFWGESVMNLYYDLSQKPVRKYKERMQTDLQISAGYMHSGYPFMTFLDQDVADLFVLNPASLPVKVKSPDHWGHYHELGHNFQIGDWTYSKGGEVTVNIFSLYLEEHFPDGKYVYGDSRNANLPNRLGIEDQMAKTADLYNSDIWVNAGLLMQIDLVNGFGWVSMKAFIASYNNASIALPKNDQEKVDQWLTRYSQIVGRDLTPFYTKYTFPISQTAKDLVTALSLPKWTPSDYILDCKLVKLDGTPCASLNIDNLQASASSSKYEFTITTWAPVKDWYGEQFVITMTGSMPSISNGTILTLNVVQGNIMTSALVLSYQNKTIIFVKPTKFIESGVKLIFNFQASNSQQQGVLTTTIKQVNSDSVLINMPERKLETSLTITSAPMNEFSADEKIAILAKHNQVRLGTLTPPAASIGELVWDSELERVATAYASKCIWEHNAARTSDYGIGYVGENLFASSSFTGIGGTVDSWASESQYFTYPSTCASGKSCGHYTQLVWENTKKVGCAKVTCPSISGLSSAFKMIVVCDYYPGGNSGGNPYVELVVNTNNNNGTSQTNNTSNNTTSNSNSTTNNPSSNSTNATNNGSSSVSNSTNVNNATNTSNSTSNTNSTSTPNTPVNEFSAQDKIAILAKHNQVRLGTLTPAAASIGELVWDSELERVATAYASKCIWEQNKARSTDYGIEYVGENMFASSEITGIVDSTVDSWESESQYFTYPSTCASGKSCGHYTQLVWENTKKVGCARVTCASISGLSSDFKTIVVCDYYPGGNSGGDPYVKLVTNTGNNNNTTSLNNNTTTNNNATNSESNTPSNNTLTSNSTSTSNNTSSSNNLNSTTSQQEQHNNTETTSTNHTISTNNTSSNSNDNTSLNETTSTNHNTSANSNSSTTSNEGVTNNSTIGSNNSSTLQNQTNITNNTSEPGVNNQTVSNNNTSNESANQTKPITCAGIEASDSKVCSGNGVCISIDNCVCKDNFDGKLCDNCKSGFELIDGNCKNIPNPNNSTSIQNNTSINNNTNTPTPMNNTNVNNSTAMNNTSTTNSTATNNSTSTTPTKTPVNEFSADEKIALLAKHNQVRLGVLTPPAASIGELVWDSELERVATAYASKCIWEHNAARTSDYGIGYVGENLFASSPFTGIGGTVDSWASESQYFTYPSTCASGKSCGHYTQVVWENTKKVGCAKVTCPSISGLSSAFKMIVVCDYYPGGNSGGNPYVKLSITCNGTVSDSNNVCSGHGSCTSTDNCVCKDNFEGKWCDTCKTGLELVDGKCVNATAKCAYDCGSNGVCTSTNVCTCSNGFITTDIKKPCTSCPTGKTADASGKSCICNVENGFNAGSEDCTCNQALGFIDVSGTCVCNDKKGFISKQGSQCLCRTSAGYSNQNGECVRSSPICSNGCGGHGQCYFLNTLTNATDCKCDQGYSSTSGSIPCTSCSSGYSLSADGRTCKKICSPEYSGDDCTIYTPTPSCISIPSTALSFCKSYINLDNYRVKNTLFTNGAMNSTHAKDLIISGIKKLDSQASTTYTQTLTSMENQGLSCDSTCRSSLNKLICYEIISTCQLLNNLPEEKRVCKSVCDYIVSKEIQNVTISFSDQCLSLPESSCYYGSYLPPNTQCYGKSYSSPLVCSSGKGECIDIDTCSCKSGYAGPECQYSVCFQKDSNSTSVCSGHGDCYSPNSCKCEIGFTGLECLTPTCNGKSEVEGGCSFHGQCSNSHVCSCSGNFVGASCSSCKSGFTGQNCDVPICNGILATDKSVCSGRGSCESLNGQPTCVCSLGYDGSNCQNFKCNGTDRANANVCSKHGKCTNVDTCICDGNYDAKYYCSKCIPSFDGDSCTHRICSEKETCNSRGTCNAEFKCDCSGNFYGEFCDKCIEGWVGSECSVSCSASKNCNGKGTCNEDGSCKCLGNFVGISCDSCKPGWYGDKCDYSVDETTFEFNENGDMITGTIYSSMKKKISCSELIQNVDSIGSGAVCSLNGDKSSLQIVLGQNPSIQIGGTLQLKKYPNIAITVDTIDAAVKSTYYKIVAPNAALTATPTSVSKACGRIYLDASSSISLDRRPLLFSWSTFNAPSSADVEMLDSLISTQTTSGISFEASKLGVGSYTVQVIVKSSFSGEQTTASIVFTVSAETAPILTIKEGLESSMMIGSPFIITPIISFPSCYSGTGKITYTYSVETSPSTIELKPSNDLLVFSDDYTKITQEGDYYFNVKAQQSGAASVTLSFKVTAKALPLKVSFTIRDMQQSFEDPVQFSITKQDPSLPSDLSGQVKLTCLNLDTASTCTGFDDNIDQTALSFNQSMSAGLYMFTATFTKSTRTSSTSVKVTVLDQSKSAVIRMSVAPPSGTDLTAVDPSSDFILESTTLDYVSSKRVFKWSSSDIEFDSTIAINKKYLIIPKAFLSPGASYTVKVTVIDGTKQGDAELSFTVNSPPTVGILEIQPSTGVALKDEFQIKCGNGWSDNQLPLSYKFLYKLPSDATWSLLSEQSEKRSISTSLPAGNLQIKAVVYDALGAYSETTTTVSVTLPVDASSALEALSTQQQGTVTVSSLTSVLSVVSSVAAQTEEQKQALQSAGKAFVEKYFEQQAAQEEVMTESSSGTSSKLSAITSISNAAANLPDDTVSMIIAKFSSTVGAASDSSNIKMSSDDISNTRDTADKLKEHVEGNLSGAKRAIKVFSQSDLANLDSVYSKLVNVELKSAVADMPASRVKGINSFSYARLLSVPTLSGLSESLKMDINAPFNISETIQSFTELQNVENIKLVMKSYLNTNTSLNAVSTIYDFTILSTSNQIINLSGNTRLATLTLDSVSSSIRRRSTLNSEVIIVCKEWNGSQFVTSSTCSIISNSTAGVEISVQSTGSYLLVSQESTLNPTTSTTQPNPQPSTITPHTSTQPQKSTDNTPITPTTSNKKTSHDGTYIAFTILAVPIISVIAVIVGLATWLYKSKKFRQEKSTSDDVEMNDLNIA